MADDFRIDIESKINLNKAKKDLDNFLSSYKKDSLKIDVEFNGFKGNDIVKQFETIGSKASSSFAKGFSLSNNPTITEFTKYKQKLLKQINDTQKQISNITGKNFQKIELDDKTIESWSSEYVKSQQKAFEQLEKEAVKQQDRLRKIREKEASSYSNVYTDAYQSIGKKSNIQKEMSEYYRQLEKEAVKQQTIIEKINKESSSGLFEYRAAKNKSFIDKYIGQDTEALNRARNQIEEINKLQKDLLSGNLKESDIISTYDKLNNEIKKLSYSMKQVSIESSKTLEAGVAERRANEVVAYMESNTKALKEYGVELKKLEQQYRSMTTDFEQKTFDSQFKKIKSEISAKGLSGKSQLHEIGRAVKQIGEFVGIYGFLQNVAIEIPQQMLQAVQDINKSQIELTKVSTAPTNELSLYWDRASESAKKYGSTISDVINTTADWSRLGYSLKDAEKLSDATILLKNVGDNMTQESSSSGLISTLKGFKLQAEQAESIVDKVNEIANTQPIDTSGIFAGLERSASSMSAANNSLEETIALITAANSVVQDPTSIGTAFKTISMRIRAAETELEEAGLETDGMAESTAKLRQEIMALSGVDIMIDNDTFKSTYDILDELSNKWSELTDIQQANGLPLYTEMCA